VAVTVPSVIVAVRAPAPVASALVPSTRPPVDTPARGAPSARAELDDERGPAEPGAARADAAPKAPSRATLDEDAGDALAESSFRSEARLLQSAQKSLASGHAVRAWELLEDHARRFPAGALTEEREAAFVLAACALGREAEARQRRDALASRAPSSPLLPRLERSCAGSAR
jgi:hypothetical protein